MKLVHPQVYLIGETCIVPERMQAFLEAIGVPEWHTDGDSDAEVIVEAEGKLCYLSFDASLNKNLTRTGTRSNFDYIQQGLIATGHGSVLEHTAVNLMFVNVSRVLCNELVRHRAGAAYSQQSGRYVRLDELSFWVPSVIRENIELAELFDEAITHQESILRKMVKVSRIDSMTGRGDFEKKKELTSAFRRIIGNGQATSIGATYNHRALRHIIEARTSRHAEEEIRIVFNEVFLQVSDRYPAFYADVHKEMVNGHFELVFSTHKV